MDHVLYNMTYLKNLRIQIIGIDEDDKDGEYCVHYNGWNKA